MAVPARRRAHRGYVGLAAIVNTATTTDHLGRRPRGAPAQDYTPTFGLVSVDKRRLSFKCEGTKIEVGDITVAGAPQSLRTICVEGETIEAVRAVVKKGNLDFGGAVCSYIELLQTALLWTPAARTAAGIGG